MRVAICAVVFAVLAVAPARAAPPEAAPAPKQDEAAPAAATPSAPRHAGAPYGRTFGLGLVVGDPTGITAKGHLTDNVALDGALGLGFLGGNQFRLHADVLFLFRVVDSDTLSLDLYPGVGPSFGVTEGRHKHGRFRFAARVPLGAVFVPRALVERDVPIEFFLEAAPGLVLIPGVGFHIDGGLGARYWF